MLIKPTCMAVANGPAGPVLTGPLFAAYFQSAQMQNYKSALFMYSALA